MVLLTAITGHADVTIGAYQNALNGKSYNVNVRLKKGKIDIVYINMSTRGGEVGYFNFSGKKLPEFYESLKQISAKYDEWSETAKANNLLTFNKEFDVDMPKGNLFWHGVQVWISTGKRLTPVFLVTQTKPMVMFVSSGVANLNRYISETFDIVLSTPAAINDFAEIFNPDKALQRALDVESIDGKFN